MKRILVGLSATFAACGCGGSQEASTAPAKQTSASASSPVVVIDEKTTATTAEKANQTAVSKKKVEAPGLVLPEDDADVVSGKGPDLPIR